MIKAECEWLLEPAIVVAAADDCFNKPTRLQQLVAGSDDCWNQILRWLQQIVAGTSHCGGCSRLLLEPAIAVAAAD